MSWPIAFYSPVATITKDEEKARKAKMSILMERYRDKVSSLPKNADHHLCMYRGFWHFHGFWCHSKADFSVEAIMALQDDFQALPTDVFLASHPKSGTTWLKALAFAILNRNKFKTGIVSCPTHPLLYISPHDCVPFIESESFLNNPSYANGLMHTHIPYTSLPTSIISSDYRIIYLCRNPKDVLISYWHFLNKLKDDGSTPTKLDDAFELFSRGMSPYGSFWDQVIGYYMKASLERPNKVLFLKYEDLKKDPEKEVRKLDKFIGNPFTKEEEFDGSVQKIIELCGFENLREVNKDGKQSPKVCSDDIYFRKGVVGDDVNYLTTETIQTLDKITKEKFDEKARKAKMAVIIERYKDKVSALPKNVDHLCRYQGFWYKQGFWYQSKADFSVEAIMAAQDDFQLALPTDIFLASHPKTGTTWLKALSFAILNRTKFKTTSGSSPTHPLLTVSPHDCVPFIDCESFLTNPSYANGLLATHIPYTSLPKSIINTDCRIVYICRDPKDVLISSWHFLNKLNDDVSTPIKLVDAFEVFSRGMSPGGSYWDHVIGYYKASLERPSKVLLLKYEELKKDPEKEVKKLAKFLGKPFTEEEEFDGSVQKIIELCSFENLREVSNDGKQISKVLSDSLFFRKGVVGDSINYLTPEMIQTLDKITKEKFDGLDISFQA
ncbi:hypothetical protein M8C21_026193 [Ambrosia artemisiifolia]|uniref:Sulfotransferase domain-containing protein n=1 Tax=Ambrosia artemisiifolia TaxID=4212 RepID=A0AAD5GTB7_AMBAR|nr:hypothetical protein M8C21_026193 [Ambrosia artemisiifolia]